MNLVEEFEEAFLSCLDSLIIEGTDSTSELEMKIERFLGLAKRMNLFITQNKMILSSLCLEEVFNEDVNKLREEFERREELLQRQYEKIHNWQIVLNCLLEAATNGDLGTDTTCTYDENIHQASSNQLVTHENDNSEKEMEETPSNGSEYSQSPISVQLHNDPKFILVEQEEENLERRESIRIKYELHELLLMQELQTQLSRLQVMKLEEYGTVPKLQQQEQDIDATANYSRTVSNELLNNDE